MQQTQIAMENLLEELGFPNKTEWKNEEGAAWQGYCLTKHGLNGRTLTLTHGIFRGFPGHAKHKTDTLLVTIAGHHTTPKNKKIAVQTQIMCTAEGIWNVDVPPVKSPVRRGHAKWWIRSGRFIEMPKQEPQEFPHTPMKKFLELFLANNA